MTDHELLSLCEKYGLQARLWRQKFLGLLPEVNRRRLFKKKFSSIFEFAKRLAGVSEEQVRLVLNLEKKFEDKPVLHGILVNGQVSMHKLARVASIATVENQEDLAEQVAFLPQKSVETLVRDYKIENGLIEPENEDKSLRAQTLELSKEVEEKLLELQQKGTDVNALILKAVEEREQKIEQEKQEIVSEMQKTDSRYMNKRIRNWLAEAFGTKCSIPHCHRASEEIHHAQRFSLAKIHDPRYLAPMCEAHHNIAHSIDRKFRTYQSPWNVPGLSVRRKPCAPK